MKKLFLLLLTLTLFSCVSAQGVAEHPKELFGDLTVAYVNPTEVGLFSKLYHKTFKVDPIDVKEGWEYTFQLEFQDCGDCQAVNARVVFFGISPGQANKNSKKQKELYEASKKPE